MNFFIILTVFIKAVDIILMFIETSEINTRSYWNLLQIYYNYFTVP